MSPDDRKPLSRLRSALQSLNAPASIALAVTLSVVSLVVVKSISVPDIPLTIEVVSSTPLSGEVRYQGVTPLTMRGSRPIMPEQVTQIGAPSRVVTVTVVPTGGKNQGSKGIEVWVLGVDSDLTSIGPSGLATIARPEGWTYSQNALANSAAGDQALELPIQASGQVDIALLRFPWAGNARIGLSPPTREVSLYGPGSERAVFRIPVPPEEPVLQRAVVRIPASTTRVGLRLPGPAEYRLKRAWIGGEGIGLSSKAPIEDLMSSAPADASSVRMSGATTDSVHVESEEAEAELLSLRIPPYWVPTSIDLAFLLGMATLVWLAIAAFAQDGRLGDRLAGHLPAILAMMLAAITFRVAVNLYATPAMFADSLAYAAAARRLFLHGVFSTGISTAMSAGADAWQMPGYAVFLVPFNLLASRDANIVTAVNAMHPLLLAMQYLLAVMTAGVTAECADRVAGKALAAVAGVLAALYLPLAWASSVALMETLAAFVLGLLTLSAVSMVDSESRLRARDVFAFGLLGGVLVMLRPIYVLWLPIPVIWLAIRRFGDWRAIARCTLWALLGFLMIMGPWWARNAMLYHRFVPLSTSLGISRAAEMSTTLTREEQSVFDADKASGGDGYEAVADFRLKRALTTDPLGYVMGRVEKARIVIVDPYVAESQVYSMWDRRNRYSVISFGPPEEAPSPAFALAQEWTQPYHVLLLLLALVGGVFSFRWPKLLLIASVPIYTAVLYAATLFVDRYFFTAMPAVIILAAGGLVGCGTSSVQLWRALRRRMSDRSRAVGGATA
ncbi:MAG: hypothetical protein HGB10_10970 [Coriobacteriia bacterium]|nr:hypothetical protein [Coriobacteriia bacterium]